MASLSLRWEKFIMNERSILSRVLFTAALLLLILLIDTSTHIPAFTRTFIYMNILLVIAGAVQGGMWAGVLVGLESTVLIDMYLTYPIRAYFQWGTTVILAMLFFTVLSLSVSMIAASLRNACRKEYLAKEEKHRAVIRRESILAIVCHDIRNPLQIVSLAQNVIAESLEMGNLQAIPEHLKQIDVAVKRISRLTKDLADAARADEGIFRLSKKSTHVNDLLLETVSAFRTEADQKEIEISFLQEGSDHRADLDKHRFSQVASNLLENAIKFSRRGSAIGVSVRACGPEIHVSIADSGQGIPPEEQAHVFDRRWQSSEVREGEGTGLGLYIAKSIVQAHGGSISLISEPGKGSIFSFTMPRSL
jgi:signal transduction histidine kinase